MAASPSSAAATSDIEAPHSPPLRSQLSMLDDMDDSRLTDGGGDDPSEKMSRSKKSRDKDKDKEKDKDKDKDKEKDKDKDNLPQVGKIRHLKKEDGEPLWREDIQYDFLRAVFDNDQKVFTNSYDPDGIGAQTFADLYIDTMSRSTKTSKVLRDKLLSDKEAAKGMAMVCLLVNVGRMNTTLNCKRKISTSTSKCRMLTTLQSFLKCVRSYEHITPSRPSRRIKIPMPTSSCKMRPGSSRFSRVVQKTEQSQAPSSRSRTTVYRGQTR